MITEEQKQEAEKVIKLYLSHVPDTFNQEYYHATNCAIQDRLSVLEEVNIIYNSLEQCNMNYNIHERITNLTEQIEYLKSKL